MSEIKGATNFEKLFSRKLNKILKKKEILIIYLGLTHGRL